LADTSLQQTCAPCLQDAWFPPVPRSGGWSGL